MSAFVLPFTDPAAQSRARVGAKAARLAELAGVGFPVPDGFAVSVAAARAFAAAHGFTAATPAETVAAAPLPDVIAREVEAALAVLGAGPVAVRSSGHAEDLAGASFAGLYESFLDVHGCEAVLAAVARVWASAHAGRVRVYDQQAAGCASMGVLVQRMVRAEAAGVAFTADPVTGARDITVVSAVRGVGEALVSGAASADEWRVSPTGAVRIRQGDAIDARTATAVAQLARQVERRAGAPQDIEWAWSEGTVHLLQARPMTALPAAVTWGAPPGGWVRNFRLGEWIGDPVTPSFETWLLTGIEEAMHAHLAAVTGWQMPRPLHVVVNGWYFYSMNTVPQDRRGRLAFYARMPVMLVTMAMNARATAGLIPPLAHLGFDWAVREWREQLVPAHRTRVAAAAAAVETKAPGELPALIDELSASIGRNFASVLAVAGYAAKTELPLASFWTRHLADVEGSWLELVRRGDAVEPAAHDVQGLDWVHPTLGEIAIHAARPDAAVRARVVAERDGLVARARERLADRPRLRRQFDRLLAEARRAHDVREEQSRAMTLAWPVLRKAMRRIGDELVRRGLIVSADQVYFLQRAEIEGALRETPVAPLASRASERRTLWNRQRRLAAPLAIGEIPPMFKRVFDEVNRSIHGDGPARPDEIRGLPGSPGRATGRVRVIRTVEDVVRLQPGDVLVAPVTTPAWTPAFSRAVAVVTDTGSIASHASIVAREYGLPAVVATGDATSRLHDGQVVTVDGSRALVTLVQTGV